MKRQLLLAYHLHGTNLVKPALSATTLSTVAMEVLKDDIKEALELYFPDETFVQMANTLSCNGTNYSVGRILTYGSTGGLPDFVEILIMNVVHGELAFIAKCSECLV